MAKRKAKEVAVYRGGYSSPVDPATAHAELESIRKANDGTLRPADVVDGSREEDAPLHPVFTWDDYEAAEQWRQDEARRLIRNVCVVIESDDKEKCEARPVYVHTRPAEGRDVAGYQTVSAVMADEEARRAVIADALANLRGWQKRYGWLKEMAGVTAAIEAAAAAASQPAAMSM